jgi:chaperonin GroES
MNKSGIHPKGNRLLIRPLEVDTATESGIIISTGKETDREQMANTTGEVIEIGEEAFWDSKTPWCTVGDRVVFAKFAGLLYLGKDGQQYRLINDDNIVATLDADVKLVDPYLKKGV